MQKETRTFTKRAWARNGSFLRALPLKPLLFLGVKREATCKPWILLRLDVGEWGKLEIHYSHSDVPQDQAVCGHLALCKAHRLKLKYGEELLAGVDDLTLHAHIFMYFNKYLC